MRRLSGKGRGNVGSAGCLSAYGECGRWGRRNKAGGELGGRAVRLAVGCCPDDGGVACDKGVVVSGAGCTFAVSGPRVCGGDAPIVWSGNGTEPVWLAGQCRDGCGVLAVGESGGTGMPPGKRGVDV